MSRQPAIKPRTAAKRLALVALVTGLLVAILALLVPPSSASPFLRPQTRVAAIATPESQVVGLNETVLPGGSRPRAPSCDRSATGSSVAAEGGVNIEDANFAQTTASEAFHPEGNYAGQTITGMANELSSGALSPADVPVQVAVVDGNTLILNTRSALALEEAGIPRAEWTLQNVTGDPEAMQRLENQLANNGLASSGTPTVRITGR
ncbi:MAG: hypothetical protein ACRD0Z_01375 [Acidimicrobiales bacterium]